MKHKRNDPMCEPWEFKVGSVVKNRAFICKGFDLDMIFSNPTLKACNSPYMQYYFKRFLLGSYIFISDQKVKAKSNRNRNCIFSSPWESVFYASHIRHNLPYKVIPISTS